MSHVYTCAWKDALGRSPRTRDRVGYLCAFEGLGMSEPLRPDLVVGNPLQAFPSFGGLRRPGNVGSGAAGAKAEGFACVGVIDSYSHGAGVGQSISIGAYVSARNADLLFRAVRSGLKSPLVTCGWWILNYDPTGKSWYEESYPEEPGGISGLLRTSGAGNFRLNLATETTRVAEREIGLHHLYFELVPSAEAGRIRYAASPEEVQTSVFGVVPALVR